MPNERMNPEDENFDAPSATHFGDPQFPVGRNRPRNKPHEPKRVPEKKAEPLSPKIEAASTTTGELSAYLNNVSGTIRVFQDQLMTSSNATVQKFETVKKEMESSGANPQTHFADRVDALYKKFLQQEKGSFFIGYLSPSKKNQLRELYETARACIENPVPSYGSFRSSREQLRGACTQIEKAIPQMRATMLLQEAQLKSTQGDTVSDPQLETLSRALRGAYMHLESLETSMRLAEARMKEMGTWVERQRAALIPVIEQMRTTLLEKGIIENEREVRRP